MILPSDAAHPPRRWGPDQDKLHRHLLRHPSLLPQGAQLLVAVSGGQDSMALTGLLIDLRPLHGWDLNLWHGEHGWRPEAAAQSQALATWAAGRGLPLQREEARPIPETEAAARRWRYGCLRRQALALGCRHVLTGHTGSDRAETLLLHLARGCHRRGLASLRASRPLADGLRLVRPLLPFSREDTARFCAEQGLPVWIDASNEDRRFSRNRLRAEVFPVLEELHPGATTRMAAMAERLAQEEEQAEELVAMAVDSLTAPAKSELGEGENGLVRPNLLALQPANQGRVLQSWLRRHWGANLAATDMELLLSRMRVRHQSGRQDLAHGWHLRWDGLRVSLLPPRQ
ncbi:MAG: tRNA lysidine(34) synthetase TilS [Cyanobacteriota bacterium]|nr:tRNA lysidine(34) synthetase TilS [Cyanobacteriota bacterium]